MADTKNITMKVEAISELWELAGGDSRFEVHEPIEAIIELLPSPPGVPRIAYVATTSFPAFAGLEEALERCLRRGYLEPNCLGEGIRDKIRLISNQLYQALTQFAALLEWRGQGGLGPTNLFSEFETFVKVGDEWLLYEKPLHYRSRGRFPSHFGTNFAPILQGMIDEGRREPVGRSLWREAWHMRFSNPRGAHVLAVAAFEVGVKECISRLVPETEWILDNTMVPSAEQLTFQYLPSLLAEKGDLALYAPPQEYRRRIQAALSDRNKFVHRFRPSDSYREAEERLRFPAIEETLLMISDLLRLFDVYCGEYWAFNGVRTQTHQLLIDRNNHHALPKLK